jgi:hypothetical protein
VETYNFLVLTGLNALVGNSTPDEYRLTIINCFNLSQIRARMEEWKVGKKQTKGNRRRI